MSRPPTPWQRSIPHWQQRRAGYSLRSPHAGRTRIAASDSHLHLCSVRLISHRPCFLFVMFIATNFFDAGFWDRVHGGSTHLPIALALTSALLDGIGSIVRSGKVPASFRFSSYFTLTLAGLGAVPAVFFGLLTTHLGAACYYGYLRQ